MTSIRILPDTLHEHFRQSTPENNTAFVVNFCIEQKHDTDLSCENFKQANIFIFYFSYTHHSLTSVTRTITHKPRLRLRPVIVAGEGASPTSTAPVSRTRTTQVSRGLFCKALFLEQDQWQ